MPSSADIFVVGAARTAIGTFGGTLKDIPLPELATVAVKAALERSGVPPGEVGHLVMGNVMPTEPRDAYLSRVAALDAGLPKETPAMNVNRLCGSGLQAIVSAAQAMLLGDCRIAVGGGAESMSRAPYLVPAARWGARMGDAALVDYMLQILHDPFSKGLHMGGTAENVADEFGITREMMDELAAESHRRAAARHRRGPLQGADRAGRDRLEEGQHLLRARRARQGRCHRRDARPHEAGVPQGGRPRHRRQRLGHQRRRRRGGAGHRRGGKAHGLRPMARLVGYAHAGVEPRLMGIGPVPATRAVLARTGLKVGDLDVIESNEAFAAQACAVVQELGLDPAKVNPNGSGIALGHPVGATGAIVTTKAIHELQRVGGRYALVTMCIGGGQGIAAIFERA